MGVFILEQFDLHTLIVRQPRRKAISLFWPNFVLLLKHQKRLEYYNDMQVGTYVYK